MDQATAKNFNALSKGQKETYTNECAAEIGVGKTGECKIAKQKLRDGYYNKLPR